ncbi:MAG: pilus assembly protein [Magnetovibrio sp.]|nr:pilus assembly protein [Magnetovibrio sp.]
MLLVLNKFFEDCRGVAAMEFALTAPFLALMLLGVAELNNYITAVRKVSAAAYTAADLIAQETDLTSSELSELFQASRLVIHPLDDTDLTLGASSVRYDDTTGDPSVDWTGSYNGGSVSSATTLATGLGSAGESVIIVTASYTYTPIYSLILSGTLTLSETSITRPRYLDYVGLY